MKNESYMAYNDLFYNYLRNPEDVKIHKIEKVRKIRNRKIKRGIAEFSKVLHSRLPKSHSLRFDNNIKSLYAYKFIQLYDDTTGWYFNDENKIVVFDYDSLMHELFHMSSALITHKTNSKLVNDDYLGFKDGSRGRGLNEGYTQLITEKFFDVKQSYKRLINITSKLEYIIGEDKMMYLYLCGGLKALADELSKYAEEDEIMIIANLVGKTDEIYGYDYNCKDLDVCYINVYYYLFNFYVNKLLNEVSINVITKEEAITKYKSFVDEILCEEFKEDKISLDRSLLYDIEGTIKEIKVRASMEEFRLKKELEESKTRR